MRGSKERHFAPLIHVSLEELVPLFASSHGATFILSSSGMGRGKGLFQHNRFIGSIKLDNEIIKKSNLSNNATKAFWRKIKREDHRNREKGRIDPYLNVSNIASCRACYSAQADLFFCSACKRQQKDRDEEFARWQRNYLYAVQPGDDY